MEKFYTSLLRRDALQNNSLEQNHSIGGKTECEASAAGGAAAAGRSRNSHIAMQ